jgi:hypothetical protein
MLRLTGDYAIDYIINMHLFKKVLADVVEQLVKVAVVVIDVANVWRVVVVFFKDSKSYPCINAERVNRHKTFIAGLLLHDAKLTIAEVLRRYTHKVAVSLTKVAAQYEHIPHTLQCLNLVFAQLLHLLLSEIVCFFLAYLEVVDVADFIRSQRNLRWDIVWYIHLAITWIQFYTVLR